LCDACSTCTYISNLYDCISIRWKDDNCGLILCLVLYSYPDFTRSVEQWRFGIFVFLGLRVNSFTESQFFALPASEKVDSQPEKKPWFGTTRCYTQTSMSLSIGQNSPSHELEHRDRDRDRDRSRSPVPIHSEPEPWGTGDLSRFAWSRSHCSFPGPWDALSWTTGPWDALSWTNADCRLEVEVKKGRGVTDLKPHSHIPIPTLPSPSHASPSFHHGCKVEGAHVVARWVCYSCMHVKKLSSVF
jgi:hypothetical protein